MQQDITDRLAAGQEAEKQAMATRAKQLKVEMNIASQRLKKLNTKAQESKTSPESAAKTANTNKAAKTKKAEKTKKATSVKTSSTAAKTAAEKTATTKPSGVSLQPRSGLSQTSTA